MKEATRAVALRPNDTEASSLVALLNRESMGERSSQAAAKAGTQTDDAQPLERIKRTYDEASFRQAAFALEQLKAARGRGSR